MSYDRITRAMEREIDVLDEQLENGTITQAQYNKAILELENDARGLSNYQSGYHNDSFGPENYHN